MPIIEYHKELKMRFGITVAVGMLMIPLVACAGWRDERRSSGWSASVGFGSAQSYHDRGEYFDTRFSYSSGSSSQRWTPAPRPQVRYDSSVSYRSGYYTPPVYYRPYTPQPYCPPVEYGSRYVPAGYYAPPPVYVAPPPVVYYPAPVYRYSPVYCPPGGYSYSSSSSYYYYGR